MFSAMQRVGDMPGTKFPVIGTDGLQAHTRMLRQRAAPTAQRSRLRPYHLLLVVWTADLMLAALACVVSRLAAAGASAPWHAGDVGIVAATACLACLAFAQHDMRQPGQTVSLRQRPGRLIVGWLTAFGMLMLLLLSAGLLRGLQPGASFDALLTHGSTITPWMLSLFASGLAFLTVGRRAVLATLHRLAPADIDSDGKTAVRTVVVADGAHGARICAEIESIPGTPVRVLGVVDDSGALLTDLQSPSCDQDTADFRVRALLPGGLADKLRHSAIDAVVVALPRGAEQRATMVLNSLALLPIDVWLAPDIAPDADLPDCSLQLLHVQCRPLSSVQLAIKKVEDMLIAGAMVVFVAPLLLLIALAIKLESDGPVLFMQTRRGYNERLFGVMKFRTMYVQHTDRDAERQTVRGDARVTRVGRILRRFSIDELPQLFNVLRGEMSVVGPRPHALQTKAAGMLFDEVVENYASRHRVKPGITGWAQVNGWRGETDTVEKISKRVEFDLQYIEAWSLRRDLTIIGRTAVGIFTDRKAY